MELNKSYTLYSGLVIVFLFLLFRKCVNNKLKPLLMVMNNILETLIL